MSTFTALRPQPRTSPGADCTRPRTLLALAAVLAVLATLLAPTGPAAANGGSCATTPYAVAAPGSPHQISTPGELRHLAATPGDWGKHFLQTADIDLTGCDWTPIGTNAGDPEQPFTGSYDGGGNTITGLNNGVSTAGVQGFFGFTRGATLTDIDLVALTITAGEIDAGGLVGTAASTAISNSSVAGTVAGSAARSGDPQFGAVSTVWPAQPSPLRCRPPSRPVINRSS